MVRRKQFTAANITLDLQPAEYRCLIDMVYIASWVIGAHREEGDPEIRDYDDLEQKVYAQADRCGYRAYFEYDEKFQQFYCSGEYDEGSQARAFLDLFESNTFWEELSHRLAEREVVKEVGGETAYAQLEPSDRFEHLVKHQDRIQRALDKHGLDALEILD